ncbi:MAG: hypothetical protein NTV94_12690, partial [Planctomycetota bacterium]|nr:hypothetical protein [Planctomycetota bacterium]
MTHAKFRHRRYMYHDLGAKWGWLRCSTCGRVATLQSQRVEIYKEFKFEAAHRLINVPPTHK